MLLYFVWKISEILMIIQLNTNYEDKYVVNFINILNSWIYFLSWRKHYIDDMFTASQI